MDAPPLSSERSRELAALRRRAYGPDADIDDDAAAVDRLHELEALARPREESEPAPSVSSDEVPAQTDDTAAESPDAALPDPVEAARPWWRRIPVWAIAAASVAVGVAIGAGAVSLAAPRPDAILRIDASAGERSANWERDLSAWGLSAGSAQPYEDYDGLGVWMVNSDDGSRCILLEDEGRPVTVNCVGGGLDPVLDVTMYADMGAFFDTERPTGSVTRFIARGSAIEVWERWAQGSAMADTSWSDSVPRVP